MDTVIEHLRTKGRIGQREIPGLGEKECVIVKPEASLFPGVTGETFISVEDFRARFPDRAALKQAPTGGGYFDLARELEAEGAI